MSLIKIHATEYPIYKVFSNDFLFTIPLYQRPYAWTTEQAGELIEDLITALGDGNEPIDDVNPYFLGSIVLIKADKPDAQVVDGLSFSRNTSRMKAGLASSKIYIRLHFQIVRKTLKRMRCYS